MLSVKLVALSEELLEFWKEDFAEESNIEFILGDITTIHCDAIVSPANSFGFMDGGLDLALSKRFGWGVQEDLRVQIDSLEEKELLVGKSITIETKDEIVPYLISTPTMRVPMSFNIPTSVNAYLAMKALLIAAKKNEKIHTIAIPGLCTGSGKMPPRIASNQMFWAYNEIINGNVPEYRKFEDTQKYQSRLNEKGLIWDY
ncbi:MAG: O-acetyl-ADP-ribose deacetylase (regulator of RNase III) [Crocinitomicaceae bacterium]|jgi:O-acetyl-ADP-ribose deacetylase (regulator of RNase III)